MGQLVFQAALGGAVNLIGPNISATTNFTLPGADGTNGQALTTNGSGTLGFSSIVSGAAGSNTQVQFNSGGNFGASSSLTWDGTNLTSTGFSGPHNGTVGATTANTGNFTTLTTSSTVTLNGGTANGVTYLNGSKVLTSGSALTFDGTTLKNALTSSGVTPSSNARGLFLDSSGNGGLTIATGETSIGNIFFADTGDQADGYIQYDQSGRTLNFGAAAAERMRLTSTGLGIGTSSPATKLEVSGSSAVLRVSGTSGSVPQLSLSSGGVVNWTLRSNNDGGSDFTIYQDSTQRLKIDSSGNVGIGTSSPSSKLDVVGTLTSTGTTASAFFSSSNSVEGANNPTFTMKVANSSGGYVKWQNSAGTPQWAIYHYTGASGQQGNLAFRDLVAGENLVTITPAGNLQLFKNLSVGGVTASTSGAGITFPATQSASSDANTLDDYEEGTWTPNQGGGLTVVGTFSSAGTYTKIGRLVTVNFYFAGVTSVAVTAGGNMCTNLPFTTQNVTTQNAGAMTNGSNSAGGTCSAERNTTNVWATSTMSATGLIACTITYPV